MLNKSRIETQIVSLENCQFEQQQDTINLTSVTNKSQPSHAAAPNPLASSYVPKRETPIKGLIISKSTDSPFDKFMNMLANLLKRLEKIFFNKLEQKLPPTIKLKVPTRKKKKNSIWDKEEDLLQ